MIVNLSYPLAGLHEASRYIWENNPYVREWPTAPRSVFDVMVQMKALMCKGASKNAAIIFKENRLNVKLDSEWLDYIGTGGYYFIYELISDNDLDEITISATILVDPAVGNPTSGYVTEFIDTIEETV